MIRLAFMIITFILSVALIILVTIQPRQVQTLANDSTSNIGKPNYWRSNTTVKVLILLTSILFFLSIFSFMIYDFSY